MEVGIIGARAKTSRIPLFGLRGAGQTVKKKKKPGFQPCVGTGKKEKYIEPL